MKAEFNIGDRVTCIPREAGLGAWKLSGKRGEVVNTTFVGKQRDGDLAHLVKLTDGSKHWLRPADLERTDAIAALGDIGEQHD